MKETEGDLLEMFENGDFNLIVHGCNCFHTMGAGIAGQIARKYPLALTADKSTNFGEIHKLSNFSVARVGKGKIIVNLYSQYNPGNNLDKNALLLGFKKLVYLLGSIKIKIGIPEIGCGIAGGNWDEIGPEIAEIMKDHDITLVKYKPKTEENVQN